MEGSGETECSKTNPNSAENYDSDDGEHEARSKASCNEKDGRINSSNSTVDVEMEKKTSIRAYIRSRTPRLRWTPDLHHRFLQAVERVGGLDSELQKYFLAILFFL